MKKLYLVRHAKSDWTYEGLPDIDRPLNEKGYRNAHYMSKHLGSKKHIPDGVITSHAIRAINTALIFSRNLGFPENRISIDPNLYQSTVETFITQLSGIHEDLKNVFVFAHNPTITKLVNVLTDSNITDMPTCSIACIEYRENSWKATQSAALLWVDFPKNHQQ
jgi:phosphohistidine phosphatase